MTTPASLEAVRAGVPLVHQVFHRGLLLEEDIQNRPLVVPL